MLVIKLLMWIVSRHKWYFKTVFGYASSLVGASCTEGLQFICELGNRICDATHDPMKTSSMFPLSCACVHAHTGHETSAHKKPWNAHKLLSLQKWFLHISYSPFQIPTSSGKCCTKEILRHLFHCFSHNFFDVDVEEYRRKRAPLLCSSTYHS